MRKGISRGWNQGWLQLPINDISPIDVLEIRVRLDGISVIGTGAKTLWYLAFEEFSDKVSGIGGQVWWETELPFQYLFYSLLAITSSKRRSSCQHIVHQGTKWPPINSLTMAVSSEDLRCHVLDGTAKSAIRWQVILKETIKASKNYQIFIKIHLQGGK